MLLVALVATPVSASSLGVSPSSPLELNIPSNGEGKLDFIITGVTGNLHIDLEDIPLSLTPSDVSVVNGQIVTVAIQGDGTNNIYQGKIRFLAASGDFAALGIKVRLTVNVGLTTAVPLSIPVAEVASDGIVPPSTISSQDGKVSLSIPFGAIIRTVGGQQIYDISVTPITNPPPAPQNSSIIGMTYNFEPSGVTFDSPITLTFRYSDSDIPNGVDESNLIVACYDESAGKWVSLEGCIVDSVTNTITVPVSHFSRYAILAQLPTVSLPLVAPTIPEPVVPQTPTPPEIIPTPSITSPAPEQPIAPAIPSLPSSSFRGLIIFGVVVLAFIIGLVGYVAWFRKKVHQ